ncbi:MAG: hypothetical protein ACRDL0_01780 [Thermoleophilaceae bacterium]
MPDESDRQRPERYEPLPGFAELPRWAWRKMGRGGRVAAGVLLLALIGLGVALAPGIRETKEERAESERRERAERRDELVRRLRAEQRPRFRRSDSVAPAGASASERLAARAELMDELYAAVLADARRRVRSGALEGPIRRTECEPFPRTSESAGAHRSLSQRRGRYSCVAVTSEFGRSAVSIGGVIGYPYRVKVDFETGRYAYCKISGRAGPTADPLVTTPAACGG